jgi:3-hydroxybutyryl-CoA dehydrogenase
MDKSKIKKIAVVGAGLMGTGIALEFARFGYQVTMQARREETLKKGMQTAREDLELMAEAELIPNSMVAEAMSRIQATTNMTEAVAGAGHVIESVPEVLTQKQEIFGKLDEICAPDVILASNASGLRTDDMAAGAKNHPERVVTTHYWQPAHLIPLVEVICGKRTAPNVIKEAADLLRSVRKRVVVQEHEMPAAPAGWGNRLQWPLGGQARMLIDEAGCNPYTIDDLIRFGFGRRLAFTAMYMRQDLIGLDWSYNVDKELGREPWGPVKERVERGELGLKTGKGFYDWSGDKPKKFIREFNLELIHLLKRDMANGDI